MASHSEKSNIFLDELQNVTDKKIKMRFVPRDENDLLEKMEKGGSNEPTRRLNSDLFWQFNFFFF